MAYLFTLGDTSYPLTMDCDIDYMACTWDGDIPNCPTCRQALTEYCDYTTKAPVQAVWQDDYRVNCDNCGWQSTSLKETK